MPVGLCPKCKASCEITEAAQSLGNPFKCQCGCTFEMYTPVPEPIFADEVEPTFSFQVDTSFSHLESLATEPDRSDDRLALGFISVSFISSLLLWRFNWFFVLLFVAIAGAMVSYRRKRSWKAENQTSLWHFAYEKSLEFFVPLGIATLFYLTLAFVVGRTTSETTLAQLESLDSLFASVQSLLGKLIPKTWIGVTIIFSLLILDLLFAIYTIRTKLAPFYRATQKWIKRAYVLAMMLCAFTFLGSEVGVRRADLTARAEKLKGGYSEIRSETEEALRNAVQSDLFAKVRISFPRDKGQVDSSDIADAARKLNSSYEAVKKFGWRDSHVEELLGRYRHFAEAETRVVSYTEPRITQPNPRTEPQRFNSPTSNPPKTLSEGSMTRTLNELKNPKVSRARAVEILKLDSSKALLCEFPKSFTGAIKSAAFSELIKSHPMLGPLVDTFVGLFNKEVEGRIRSSADRVADALLANSEHASEIIESEAKILTASTEVKQSSSFLSQMKQAVVKMSNQLIELKAADETVTKKLDELDPWGNCMCGGRFIGRTRRSQCPTGSRC